MSVFNRLPKSLVADCMVHIRQNDIPHREDHVEAVGIEAIRIAQAYGLSETKMLLAALCHDLYSGRNRTMHHILAAEWVRDNLDDYGYDPETVDDVAQMCAEHRASLKGDYSSQLCEAFSAADRGPMDFHRSVTRSVGKPLAECTADDLPRLHDLLDHLRHKFTAGAGYARPNRIHDVFYKEDTEKFQAMLNLSDEELLCLKS